MVAGGHCCYEGRELRAEGEDYRKACRDADNAGIIDLAESEDAGVLAVGSVCGCAEECRESGRKAVAEESAVQSGVSNKVLADGGGYRANIADVLDHGRQGQRNDGEQCAQEHAGVNIHAEEVEHAVFPYDGQADPLGGCDLFRDSYAGGGDQRSWR